MTISEKIVEMVENSTKIVENAPTIGRQLEYDAFWDAFQDNGNRTNYTYAFINNWTTEIFKPKYPITAVGDASYMFDSCKIGNQETPDFDFVENGVILDTSGATSLTYMFRNCKGIKRVGTIDCTSIRSDINRTFSWCKVVTIDKLVVKETLKYDNPFVGASYLENITIEGIIGNNISFGDCTKLTKDSLMSIINALKDGVSVKTCTLGSDNLAKLTNEEKIEALKKGWDIGLADKELSTVVMHLGGVDTEYKYLDGMTWGEWCNSIYNTSEEWRISDWDTVYNGVVSLKDYNNGDIEPGANDTINEYSYYGYYG